MTVEDVKILGAVAGIVLAWLAPQPGFLKKHANGNNEANLAQRELETTRHGQITKVLDKLVTEITQLTTFMSEHHEHEMKFWEKVLNKELVLRQVRSKIDRRGKKR